MKTENEVQKVITGTKVTRIVSLIGVAASVLGLILTYFDDGDYWLFILLLLSNLFFLINEFNKKSDTENKENDDINEKGAE